MIKTFLSILSTTLICDIVMNAQNISVDSCKICEKDSTWALFPRTDINDNPCSVVKILNKNIIGKLEFKGNIIEERCEKDSSIYTLYVPNRTKHLKIYHPDYIPETVDFTNYCDSPYGLELNKVYYLYLSVPDMIQQSDISFPTGSRVLLFSSNTELKSLLVDGNEWKIKNGRTSQRLLSYGIHKYEAVNIDGIHIRGEIRLLPSLSSEIIKLNFD